VQGAEELQLRDTHGALASALSPESPGATGCYRSTAFQRSIGTRFHNHWQVASERYTLGITL